MTTKALLRYSLSLILSTILLCVFESASAEVIFKADFETGDLSEWSKTGTRGQNVTSRNVQVVTDIVQEGKYAGKFTIHENDMFNAQQLRVQVVGPSKEAPTRTCPSTCTWPSRRRIATTSPIGREPRRRNTTTS